MMLKKNLLLLAFALIGITAFSQQPSKDELEKRQAQLKNEIAELNRTLSNIQGNKKRSLSELTAVKRKIAAREELVNNISKDLRRLDDNIYAINLDIYRYSKELDTLKRQYAQSLVFAYKNRSNYDYLNFIFSASSFNDAIKRIEYLKSYRKQRETQLNTIVKTQQVLAQKRTSFQSSIQEKNMALKEQSKTLEELENDKKEKDKVVAGLKSQEKDLAGELKKKERERKELANALAAVIKRELEAIRKREEEEKKKAAAANAGKPTAPAKTTTTTPNTAPATSGVTAPVRSGTVTKFDSPSEEQSLAFEANRGRLPWPVESGSIALNFGPFEVPGSKLKGSNPGIDVALSVGATVKSVADGEVSIIMDIGGEEAVIIRHGKYFTTYSHLSSVNVAKGQKVHAGTVLGKVAADETGNGLLTFIVTNERGTNLDPEKWLKRR